MSSKPTVNCPFLRATALQAVLQIATQADAVRRQGKAHKKAMEEVPQSTLQGGNPQMMMQLQQEAYNKAMEKQGPIVPRFVAPEILNMLDSPGVRAAVRCEGRFCGLYRHDRDGDGYCGMTRAPEA